MSMKKCGGCATVYTVNLPTCPKCERPNANFVRSPPVKDPYASKAPEVWSGSRPDKSAEVAALMLMLKNPNRPSKQWAHNLKEREEKGENLSNTQRGFWREALKSPITNRVPGEDDE